jgi:hypothetical protein
MKLPLIAALSLFAASAYATDPSAAGTVLVTNNHGGYNVAEPGARPATLPFFGTKGFAAKVIAHSHDKVRFILVPVVEDVGHGGKITVYKRIYFATPEEAEAAKLTPYAKLR